MKMGPFYEQFVNLFNAKRECSDTKHTFDRTIRHAQLRQHWMQVDRNSRHKDRESSSVGCSHLGVATADAFSNIRTEHLAVFYAGCPSWRNLLLIVGNLARPFNVLGRTLEGNQLRHCAAKPIASGYHSKHKWVFTPGVLRSRDQPILSRTHYLLQRHREWMKCSTEHVNSPRSSSDYSLTAYSNCDATLVRIIVASK